MKLQYRTNNAYSYMIVFDEDHAEIYFMNGEDDFPILDTESAAREYLNTVALNIENLSGADREYEREEDEPVDDFFSRICVDDDHCKELIAEIDNTTRIWYAVEMDEDDNDWGTGSFDYDEAVAMARRMEAKFIAVIRLGDDPICERVIDLTEEDE